MTALADSRNDREYQKFDTGLAGNLAMNVYIVSSSGYTASNVTASLQDLEQNKFMLDDLGDTAVRVILV